MFLFSNIFYCRESSVFHHGRLYSYQIESSKDLGDLTVIQIHWVYDDEVKLLDFSRICLMFICSKSLYTDSVTVSMKTVESSNRGWAVN